MSQEWMIDVLTDLRTFAHKNGLIALAEQLEDTILVAESDLTAREHDRAGAGHGHTADTGPGSYRGDRQL